MFMIFMTRMTIMACMSFTTLVTYGVYDTRDAFGVIYIIKYTEEFLFTAWFAREILMCILHQNTRQKEPKCVFFAYFVCITLL